MSRLRKQVKRLDTGHRVLLVVPDQIFDITCLRSGIAGHVHDALRCKVKQLFATLLADASEGNYLEEAGRNDLVAFLCCLMAWSMVDEPSLVVSRYFPPPWGIFHVDFKTLDVIRVSQVI